MLSFMQLFLVQYSAFSASACNFRSTFTLQNHFRMRLMLTLVASGLLLQINLVSR